MNVGRKDNFLIFGPLIQVYGVFPIIHLLSLCLFRKIIYIDPAYFSQFVEMSYIL